MCATRAALVLLFAVIACAVAIPAALPQPESSPVVGPGAPLVAIEEQQRSALEKRQISSLENEPEPAGDLKASSTYGYGYYHGYGYGYPYRPYYGYGWGYPYGYGYGYPYYRPFYPYYGYYY